MGNVNRYRVLGGDGKNVLKLIVEMISQLCKFTKKTTELYTLNG